MAGAGKKTFTAGEILTASDTNTYLMEQTVMNFAGTAARASAIPTPSEGMTTYNQATKQLESYNGTDFIGMSGLQLVKKQTVGSAVTSVAVTSAFSATYENYLIVYSNGTASGANLGLQLQLGSTTSNYSYALNYALYSTGVAASLGSNAGSNFPYAGATNANGANILATIEQPFLSKNTFVSNTYRDDTAGGNNNGVLKNTTSYTGFTIFVAGGGNITGGTIYVYGYGV
jgi:hypothetical protein